MRKIGVLQYCLPMMCTDSVKKLHADLTALL